MSKNQNEVPKSGIQNVRKWKSILNGKYEPPCKPFSCPNCAVNTETFVAIRAHFERAHPFATWDESCYERKKQEAKTDPIQQRKNAGSKKRKRRSKT